MATGQVVLYPGSFDPFHLGHLDVAAQAVSIFGSVVIAVMHNPEKPAGMFSVDERVQLAKDSTAHVGLAIDAARKVQATCIVKSLRSATDFDIESQMAHTNYTVSGVRTMVLFALPEHAYISSRFVREIAHYGGDASAMVTAPVAKALASRARR